MKPFELFFKNFQEKNFTTQKDISAIDSKKRMKKTTFNKEVIMRNILSVIETKELGNAREAYETYYTKQKKYHQYFSRYQKLVKAYAARKLLTIKIQEMRYLDNMANTSEQLQNDYFKIKSILADKFHQIMLDIKQKETDVAAYTQLITDELGLDDG